MWPFAVLHITRFLNSSSSRLLATRRLHSADLEYKYSDAEKERIIQVINESDAEVISKYEITKARIKHFSHWKSNDGTIQRLSDMHLIDELQNSSNSVHNSQFCQLDPHKQGEL
ncbi:Uncharacterized protein OBRU01_01051 [Operophtera brumata]|uniref:Uncharacterized protein n=1 Tax=Operophtera brumata TaxID=104452 RepID=A0A0L7LUF5_OPEBR|nr:Uncharacterized protein OBRU01_01051 [Operophtera brumata]